MKTNWEDQNSCAQAQKLFTGCRSRDPTCLPGVRRLYPEPEEPVVRPERRRMRPVASLSCRNLAPGATHRRREVVSAGTQRAEFLPLLRGEDAADGKGHLGVSLLQRCARGGDAVDGAQHGVLIGIIGFQQGFEFISSFCKLAWTSTSFMRLSWKTCSIFCTWASLSPMVLATSASFHQRPGGQNPCTSPPRCGTKFPVLAPLKSGPPPWAVAPVRSRTKAGLQ